MTSPKRSDERGTTRTGKQRSSSRKLQRGAAAPGTEAPPAQIEPAPNVASGGQLAGVLRTVWIDGVTDQVDPDLVEPETVVATRELLSAFCELSKRWHDLAHAVGDPRLTEAALLLEAIELMQDAGRPLRPFPGLVGLGPLLRRSGMKVAAKHFKRARPEDEPYASPRSRNEQRSGDLPVRERLIRTAREMVRGARPEIAYLFSALVSSNTHWVPVFEPEEMFDALVAAAHAAIRQAWTRHNTRQVKEALVQEIVESLVRFFDAIAHRGDRLRTRAAFVEEIARLGRKLPREERAIATRWAKAVLVAAGVEEADAKQRADYPAKQISRAEEAAEAMNMPGALTEALSVFRSEFYTFSYARRLLTLAEARTEYPPKELFAIAATLLGLLPRDPGFHAYCRWAAEHIGDPKSFSTEELAKAFLEPTGIPKADAEAAFKRYEKFQRDTSSVYPDMPKRDVIDQDGQPPK